MRKSDLIYLITAIFLAGLAACFGTTLPDKITNFIILLLLIGILVGFIKAIKEIGHTHFFVKLCLLIALFFSFFMQIRNIMFPIVTSDLIELEYNLRTPEFIKTNKQKLVLDSGEYYLERTSKGLYRIYMPYKIYEAILFNTSYDRNGKHLGMTNWTKAHFIVQYNYIESKHVLNENRNQGEGRHMIIYQHRTPFREFFRNSWKIIKKQILI